MSAGQQEFLPLDAAAATRMASAPELGFPPLGISSAGISPSGPAPASSPSEPRGDAAVSPVSGGQSGAADGRADPSAAPQLFDVLFEAEDRARPGYKRLLVMFDFNTVRLYRGVLSDLEPHSPVVTLDAAQRLAEAVLAGDARASTWPQTTMTLAAALIALTRATSEPQTAMIAVPPPPEAAA